MSVSASDDDFFADTRMSFGDHIEVLRFHMVRAIAGFMVTLVISLLYLGQPVMEFIAAPVSDQLMQFYVRRVDTMQKRLEARDPALVDANEPQSIPLEISLRELAKALNLPARPARPAKDPDPADPAGRAAASPDDDDFVKVTARIRPVDMSIKLAKAGRLVDRPPTLSSFTITEAFMVYLKVCMYTGVVLGSPWIFYQLWSFVAAGLYPHEKRLVNVYLPVSITLFLLGVLLCQFVVLPVAIRYLLSFNEWMGIEPELRLSEWLNFALLTPIVFGLAFQTPLVMLALHRFGIVTDEMYRQHRRIAYFGLACVAIVLAASPDAFSMTALMVPMWGLYEVGILMCSFYPTPAFEDESSDLGDMVEV